MHLQSEVVQEPHLEELVAGGLNRVSVEKELCSKTPTSPLAF